jgi:hypothetical protein
MKHMKLHESMASPWRAWRLGGSQIKNQKSQTSRLPSASRFANLPAFVRRKEANFAGG